MHYCLLMKLVYYTKNKEVMGNCETFLPTDGSLLDDTAFLPLLLPTIVICQLNKFQ